MLLFPILILFILGLCIGSFLNVVIFRTHDDHSLVRGRSHCMHCNLTLSPRDLVPVASWLLLGGRCRGCRKPISWQYPLVELSVGVIFAAIYVRYVFGLWLPDVYQSSELVLFVLRDTVFVAFLTVLFVYDVRYMLLLDRFTIPAIIVAILFNLLVGVSAGSLLLGALLIGGFFAAQYTLSKGAWVGGGDLRMGAMMGCMLGWRDGLLALFLAYFLGALVGSFLLLRRKAEWKTHIPFGTFLAVGTVLSLFFAQPLLHAYLGFFTN